MLACRGLSVSGSYAEGANDYDTNWLVVELAVGHPKGSWTKTDPGLLTWELSTLGDWLRRIHATHEEHVLEFIEPNLRFRYHPEEDCIRIFFDLEYRPPWSKDTDSDVCVVIPAVRVYLQHASESIQALLEKYPIRR